MSIKNDPFFFETFRPNYEMRAAITWFAVSFFYAIYVLFDYFTGPSTIIFYLCLGMGIYMYIPGRKRMKQTLRLAGEPLPVLTFKDLEKNIKDEVHAKDCWMGKGFLWGQPEAQNASQILAKDYRKITKDALGFLYYWRYFTRNKALFFTNPFKFFHNYFEEEKRVVQSGGQTWIHGCGPEEKDLYLPIRETDRHVLIVGSTGSGKTRCFDLLICQAILRGETVIVIDPKADPDLQSKIARACKELHREHNFYTFNPSRPDTSVKLNLLATWTNATELATRISTLMPSGGSSDAFTSFAWYVVNTFTQAQTNILKKNPTLKSFINFIQGRMPQVVCEVIETYLLTFISEKDLNEFLGTLKREAREDPDLRGAALIKLYRSWGRYDRSVDDIIELFEHNREHLSKMITSLIPILSMLTSGNVGEMLSPPDPDDPRDVRNITASKTDEHKSIAELIKSNSVLYIGLNNLADAKVGTAIGMLVLADVTATAGNIYNYEMANDVTALPSELGPSSVDSQNFHMDDLIESGSKKKHIKHDVPRVNVFIDEAAEVTSQPFIQLLNKGRGAGVRVHVATQTVADFAAVTGSKDKATQTLANACSLICLQIQDGETAKHIGDMLPDTKIATIQHAQSQNIGAESIVASGASITQRREEKDAPIFPRTLLSMLPPLEYIAWVGGSLFKGRIPILVTQDRESFFKRFFKTLFGVE